MEANATFTCIFIFILYIGLPNVSSVDMKRKTAILNQTTTLNCSHFCRGNVTWTSDDGRPVIDCQNRPCQAGKGFENRVRITDERVDGKHSLDLIIDVVKFNDQGGYVGTCDGHYCDYKLEVLMPLAVNVSTGDSASLPCFVATQKDDKAGYILWEKDGMPVLLVEHGLHTFGPKLENRLFVSKDGHKNGDLSLHIIDVRPSDQGVYHCHYSPTRETDSFRGGPNSVRLNVQEKPSSWSCPVVTLVTLITLVSVQAIIYGLYKGIPHLNGFLKAPRVSVAEQNVGAFNSNGNPKDYSTVRPTD